MTNEIQLDTLKTNINCVTGDLHQPAPATDVSTKTIKVRDAVTKLLVGLLILMIGWLAVKARSEYGLMQKALDGSIELLNQGWSTETPVAKKA
jgi:hypothetical protein